ncbi:MAG TPA: FkbM family methyltransferase [Pyrinomonadaceae bacterium]|nr:FkbM family methyltransferase [Pyrinomonadaceae bacterium]
MQVSKTLRYVFDQVVPLRSRNAIRLALKRHPFEYRLRWPDLSLFGLSKNDIVFDVGANVGDFVDCVLAHQPWAVVHAFEPIPAAFQCLSSRFKEYQGIYCRNIALGSTRHEGRLNVSRYQQASSFLENGQLLDEEVYGIDFTVGETKRVSVDTVTEYSDTNHIDRIKLLKLDVQGYEIEVLKGAEPILRRIDYIYAEGQFQELYKDGPLYSDIFEFLNQRNFKLERMTSFRADDNGKLMECDMIFRNGEALGNA